jgi:hypothetical protein
MSSDKIDVNDEEIEKATISVNDEGLEKGTIECEACNLPTQRFMYVEVGDKQQGKFIQEKWCLKCVVERGEQKRDQKKGSR